MSLGAKDPCSLLPLEEGGQSELPPEPEWCRAILNAAIWGEFVAALCLFSSHLGHPFSGDSSICSVSLS